MRRFEADALHLEQTAIVRGLRQFYQAYDSQFFMAIAIDGHALADHSLEARTCPDPLSQSFSDQGLEEFVRGQRPQAYF